MAFGEFFSAYDWHESFDYTFHLFFPQAGLPFTGALFNAAGDDWNDIADLISFLHIRWPIAEPARVKAARDHLKSVVALSRQTWDAIEAETDNDNEWLPNPRQTSPFAALTVSEAHIQGWRALLDEADLILDGKILVPHWRFKQGFASAAFSRSRRPSTSCSGSPVRRRCPTSRTARPRPARTGTTSSAPSAAISGSTPPGSTETRPNPPLQSGGGGPPKAVEGAAAGADSARRSPSRQKPTLLPVRPTSSLRQKRKPAGRSSARIALLNLLFCGRNKPRFVATPFTTPLLMTGGGGTSARQLHFAD
jgi:hypothetical protein